MQAVATLPPGTILGNEKYRILAARGQGGFGITYAGWDISLERNVAVKECFPQDICVRDAGTLQIAPRTPALQDAYLAAMADLQREARLLAGLNHPNIVQVHDVFAANGSLFCVMHWLEGDTLRDRLDAAEAADAPIPPEQAEEWLRQLLDALGYMHTQGVIHRDIKPENIMFNEGGRPVLVDFGSAVNISRLTHTLTQGAFSAAYAAPEQISGKGEIGPWTDLYSLAATWYEVFSNCAAEETVRRLLEDSLAPLEKLVPERVHAAPHMAAGIMRNLGLHATDRCQSAAEWLAMLDGKPQPRRPRRSRRQWKRSGLLWAGALAAAVLGLVAYQATAPRGGQDEEEPATKTAGDDEEKVDLDALTERAWDYYGIGKLVEKNRQFETDGAKIADQFSEDCRKLRERCQSDQTLAEDPSPANSEYKSIAAAYEKKLRELDEKNEREVLKPYREAMNSMYGGLGWPGLTTAEKNALILTVSGRINSKVMGQCKNLSFYILSSTNKFSQLESQEERALEDVLHKWAEKRQQLRESRRQQEAQQREIDKERITEELYAKVRAQSGMVELMQKAEQMQKEYAAIIAEGAQAMKRIAREGIAKAKAAPMKEVSKIQSDTDVAIRACAREYEKKRTAYQDRFEREAKQPLTNIVDNCSRSSDFSFIMKEDRDFLAPTIRDRINEEIEPYTKLPYVADADRSAASEMLREGIMEVRKQKEAGRDAAVERLYRKVVDEKKLEALAKRREELNQQRRELFKACDEELERYATQVVPQIKAKPRKEWAAAINAAEQVVSSTEYDYQLKEKPLIEESQKVASVARSYLHRMEKGTGEEFSGLTDEEKELLPDVSRMAGEKVDGGHWKWNVTSPMVETNAFYRTKYIERRVYKDVDMDALQEENEKEAMRELGL